jgi:ferric-dicitrate binding protein FerR (iron transport regulator)
MTVDGNQVISNATLFDGTVVETAQKSATLRLDKGVQITLAPDSRGALYRDHFELQKGESQVDASRPFPVQANGLTVTANQRTSKDLVMVMGSNQVAVNSLSGAFNVMDGKGLSLATVGAGKSMTFARPADGSGGGSASGSGGSGGGWWSQYGTWVYVGAIAAGIGIAEWQIHSYYPSASR